MTHLNAGGLTVTDDVPRLSLFFIVGAREIKELHALGGGDGGSVGYRRARVSRTESGL